MPDDSQGNEVDLSKLSEERPAKPYDSVMESTIVLFGLPTRVLLRCTHSSSQREAVANLDPFMRGLDSVDVGMLAGGSSIFNVWRFFAAKMDPLLHDLQNVAVNFVPEVASGAPPRKAKNLN